MDIVIDANVIFSALIKNSFSYNIIFSDKFRIFTPEYMFAELEKHKEEIIDKTERTSEEFFRLIEIFDVLSGLKALPLVDPFATLRGGDSSDKN